MSRSLRSALVWAAIGGLAVVPNSVDARWGMEAVFSSPTQTHSTSNELSGRQLQTGWAVKVPASPTPVPTESPAPSPSPSDFPTALPTITGKPTSKPTPAPTESPAPSPSPSDFPTKAPTHQPSSSPTPAPTVSPAPTDRPSVAPSDVPSATPSDPPSPAPTLSTKPSHGPTLTPSDVPSTSPTASPAPSAAPSPAPSVSAMPSNAPSYIATYNATLKATLDWTVLLTDTQLRAVADATAEWLDNEKGSGQYLTHGGHLSSSIVTVRHQMLVTTDPSKRWLQQVDNATEAPFEPYVDVTFDAEAEYTGSDNEFDLANIFTTEIISNDPLWKHLLGNYDEDFLGLRPTPVEVDTSSTQSALHDNGLSPGGKFGISVVVLVAMGVGLGAAIFAIRSHRDAQANAWHGTELVSPVQHHRLMRVVGSGTASSPTSLMAAAPQFHGNGGGSMPYSSGAGMPLPRQSTMSAQFDVNTQTTVDNEVNKNDGSPLPASHKIVGRSLQCVQESGTMISGLGSPNTLENGNATQQQQRRVLDPTSFPYGPPTLQRDPPTSSLFDTTTDISAVPPTKPSKSQVAVMMMQQQQHAPSETSSNRQHKTKLQMQPVTHKTRPPKALSRQSSAASSHHDDQEIMLTKSGGGTLGAMALHDDGVAAAAAAAAHSEYTESHHSSFFASMLQKLSPRNNGGSPKKKPKQQRPLLDDSDDDDGYQSGGVLGAQAPGSNALQSKERNSFESAIRRNGLYDVFAPAGPIGIVVDTTKHGPAVHSLKSTSPMLGLITPGDLIVGLDDEDTRAMTAATLTRLMARKANQTERKITLLASGVE